VLSRPGTLVLILSSHSSHSKQIPREVEIADRYHLSIVSLRVEDVQPSEWLEYFLQNIQWIDAFDDRFENAITRLIAAIQTGTESPAERTRTLRVPDRDTFARPVPIARTQPERQRARSRKPL
jgi:hypothetical protein